MLPWDSDLLAWVLGTWDAKMDASLHHGPGVGEPLLMTEDLVHWVGLQSLTSRTPGPGSGTLIRSPPTPAPSLGKQCPPKGLGPEPAVL